MIFCEISFFSVLRTFNLACVSQLNVRRCTYTLWFIGKHYFYASLFSIHLKSGGIFSIFFFVSVVGSSSAFPRGGAQKITLWFHVMIFVDVYLEKSSWDLLKDERRRNQELKEGQQPQYWARRYGLLFKGPCTDGIFCGFESPGIPIITRSPSVYFSSWIATRRRSQPQLS